MTPDEPETTVTVRLSRQAVFDTFCAALHRGDTEAAANAAFVLVAGGAARYVGSEAAV